jgi:Phage P22-like portal protein
MPVDVRERDQALLKELRERYTYLSERWKKPREERRTDLRYLGGDPWEDDDRQARKDAGRPCINHDELGQYVIAAVNNMRQNPRGIKIDPGGSGATSKSAELRQGLILGIENRSQAKAVYLSAYQDMVEGGYGFMRVNRKYVTDTPGPEAWNQEIIFEAILNPDSVLYDYDCKKADWSDGRDCFVLDPLKREDFKRRWPEAEITDFTPDDMRIAKDWINDKQVLTAEYWRVETQPGYLYLLEDGSTVTTLPKGQTARRKRPWEKKKLVQYWTNGIEILERVEQPGVLLPIIPFIGLQRFMDDGSGAKRVIFSLPRLGRDPQMSLAYLCSQQMEEAGLSPKTPYVGFTGQFETDKQAWDTLTKIPHSYVQVDPVKDDVTGQVLPLPRREQFTPNFAGYEAAKDSCRRAVQAAMGIMPLPTAAQRNNEKSGVALQTIENQQQVGSYHFVDGFDRALNYAGRVAEGWIAATYDTEREVALGKADDSRELVRINTEQPYQDQRTGEMKHYQVTEDGDHEVTISTGPSVASQRDAADKFLDQLVASLGKIPIPQTQQARLLGLAVRMKNLGPLGDEMADIISPDLSQPLPPHAAAQLDQAHAMIQKLSGALNSLSMKLEAKLPELATKEIIALRNNQAGILEAALKAKSEEAMMIFQSRLDQIDRIVSLLPDPGAEVSPPGPQQPQQPQAA